MANLRLVITETEVTEAGILIKKAEIIDSESGEKLKIAKLNQQLADFIKVLEISINDYMSVIDMKEKNPAFTKLCENFKLYT